MTEEWRLLETGANNAYKNMAIDWAVLVANSKGISPPTIRFYSWEPFAISIGYFQSLLEEVDLKMCKKHGVDYVRRITGGGAVYHEDELTYSTVIPENHPLIPENIMESYKLICGGIIKGLKNIDVESNYAPINDIVVNGKKISGNAQTRKSKTLLQHGTILTDVNVEKMFSLLKISNEKIKDKMIKNVKHRVTSLKHITKRKITFNELSKSMKKGFEEQFNIKLINGNLTDEEIKLSHKFEKDFFSTRDWNYKR